jgi:anthranilate phosphoribosyltransferase
MMAGVLHRLGLRRALVFAGPEGIDELGLAGPARCFDVGPDGVRPFDLDPRELDLAQAPLAALSGGDAAENAARVRGILGGDEHGAGRDVVVLNAAAALVAAERTTDFGDGLVRARDSIDSGKALRALDDLVRVSQAAAG